MCEHNKTIDLEKEIASDTAMIIRLWICGLLVKRPPPWRAFSIERISEFHVYWINSRGVKGLLKIGRRNETKSTRHMINNLSVVCASLPATLPILCTIVNLFTHTCIEQLCLLYAYQIKSYNATTQEILYTLTCVSIASFLIVSSVTSSYEFLPSPDLPWWTFWVFDIWESIYIHSSSSSSIHIGRGWNKGMPKRFFSK